MKNRILLSLFFIGIISLSMILLSFSSPEEDANRDNTPGTVSFSVTTLSEGGNYAPRHVLAIWIEKDGDFVKTRKRMANNRKQYLYTWRAASNYNVVDAITGSTLNTHTSHTVQWDCTDLDGNVVVDGIYTLFVEFTEQHAQGPLFSIDFEKSDEAISVTPPNEPHFINMEFSYEPEVVLLADFSSDTQNTCVDQTVVFTDNSTGATSWEWNFGEGATPATASTQGPHDVAYNMAGNKTVSLTIDEGVDQTKTDYISVSPNATAGFSWTQVSRTFTFTNSSAYAVSYLWEFGDGNTSDEENPVHMYDADGTYAVSLTANSEMCTAGMYSEDIVINTVGIFESVASNQLNIFPNPGNGVFQISPAMDLHNVSLRIFDAQGRIVYQQNIGSIGSGNEVSAGSYDLNPGLYFMDIKSDQGNWLEKVLVK